MVDMIMKKSVMGYSGLRFRAEALELRLQSCGFRAEALEDCGPLEGEGKMGRVSELRFRAEALEDCGPLEGEGKMGKNRGFLLLLVVGCWLLVFMTLVSAVPQTINVHGCLTGSGDAVLAGGNFL